MRPRETENGLSRSSPIGRMFTRTPAAAATVQAKRLAWRRAAGSMLIFGRRAALLILLALPTVWAAQAPMDIHAARQSR